MLCRIDAPLIPLVTPYWAKMHYNTYWSPRWRKVYIALWQNSYIHDKVRNGGCCHLVHIQNFFSITQQRSKNLASLVLGQSVCRLCGCCQVYA